jgi:16S rRNA pseudouridine516 synthase
VRIDKLISDSGLLSRKETALAAKRGQLLVDGVPVRDVSRHIDPEVQTVTLFGRVVEYRKFTYVMLNKPEGYVSATEDSSLPVVTDLLPLELRRQELFPVGRLDKDTVGLMILTNNGGLAHTLLSPKRHVSKLYRFESADPLPEGAEARFKDGLVLGDGYECKSAKIVLDDSRDSGEITLTEGKYHQIKRMVAALGSRVTYLERIAFADIPLDASLSRGEWRFLTEDEIASLLEKAK